MSDPVTMYLGARLDYYKKCEGVFWNTTTPLNATSPSETHVEISPKIAFDYKADDKTNYLFLTVIPSILLLCIRCTDTLNTPDTGIFRIRI